MIVISDKPGATLTCHPEWTIGKAGEEIRYQFDFRDGSIQLNGEMLDTDLTFAEEIQAIIGEGIDTLQFDGTNITSHHRGVYKFTFINGEKEF